MSGLTTHVLDLVAGCPAAGVRIRVARYEGDVAHPLAEGVTNADGRIDPPLVAAADFVAGIYELSFHVGDYFAAATAAADAAPRFLDVVPLRFGVSDATRHYHVPLLVTPWGFSTYRGS